MGAFPRASRSSRETPEEEAVTVTIVAIRWVDFDRVLGTSQATKAQDVNI